MYVNLYEIGLSTSKYVNDIYENVQGPFNPIPV